MRTIVAVTLFGLAPCLFAAEARAQEHKVAGPGEIKWGDAPPVLPRGAKLAVMFGDPSKEGLFIVRLKMPAGYKIAPHWHPTDENVTVLSGAFAIGMGEAIDPKTRAMPAGSFFSLGAKMHHFAFTTQPTVVEVSAMGPFVINYLDPGDDPSKAAPASAKKK
jgi:quercetin dioxygenase-like cupin family protein